MHIFGVGKVISITYSNVYVCSHSRQAYNSHKPYCIVICGLSICTIFCKLPHQRHAFGGKKVTDHKNYTKAITLSIKTEINPLRIADDQVIIAKSEDNLQRGIFTLRNITKYSYFKWKYQEKKFGTVAFSRKVSEICKIFVGKILLHLLVRYVYNM